MVQTKDRKDKKNQDCHFKSRDRKFTKHFNFRTSGPKLVFAYLSILQNDLYWKTYLKSLEKKLSKSIGLLLKIKHLMLKGSYLRAATF